jgi:hypothetical protein
LGIVFRAEEVVGAAQVFPRITAAQDIMRCFSQTRTSLVGTLKEEQSHFWLLEIQTWHGKLKQDIRPLDAVAKWECTKFLVFLKRHILRTSVLTRNDGVRLLLEFSGACAGP